MESKELGKMDANVVEMTSGTEVDGVTFGTKEVEGRGGVFACWKFARLKEVGKFSSFGGVYMLQ